MVKACAGRQPVIPEITPSRPQSIRSVPLTTLCSAFSAVQIIDMQRSKMVGIDKELKAAEAARAVLTTNSNSKATIKALREAKYVAASAMTIWPSDKPLNDARHAFVTTLSDLVKALETDPTPQQEKIDKAQGAIRNLVWALKAEQGLRLRRLADGD
jgi:hypothetical protein